MKVLVAGRLFDDIEDFVATYHLRWTNREIAEVLDELHRAGRAWCSDGPIVAVEQ